MRRFAVALVAAVSVTVVPVAEAGLIREVQSLPSPVPVEVAAIPLSPAGTLCPEVENPDGVAYSCTTTVLPGVTLVCEYEGQRDAWEFTSQEQCGVVAGGLSLGCADTSSVGGVYGSSGSRTMTCSAGSGTTSYAVTCSEAYAGHAGSSRTTTCSAWPITYTEEYASGPFTATVDRTTLTIGDVKLVCEDFPSIDMSCTTA